MITKETRQVYKASLNGKSRTFFTLDASCKWLARQLINKHEDCSCGDTATEQDGREVKLQCSYHQFLYNHPDEFKRIYQQEFRKIKSQYRSKQ